MNVNKFSNAFSDIRIIGEIAGSIAGTTVDKYDRKMPMGAFFPAFVKLT